VLNEKRMIQCPECDGKWVCTYCFDHPGTIPDRRRLTASDRAVERIKEWCAKMIMEDCACCQTAGYEVSTIIREEESRA